MMNASMHMCPLGGIDASRCQVSETIHANYLQIVDTTTLSSVPLALLLRYGFWLRSLETDVSTQFIRNHNRSQPKWHGANVAETLLRA